MPRDLSSVPAGGVPAASKPRGRWIPWMFVLPFILVFAVNGTMIYQAVKTFPGLVVEKSYERGVSYNRFIEAKEQELSLHWRAEPIFTVVDLATRLVRFDVTPQDGDGKLLVGAVVSGLLTRPIEQVAPITVPFVDFGGGRWIGDIDLPLDGQWELKVTVQQGDKRVHVTHRYLLGGDERAQELLSQRRLPK